MRDSVENARVFYRVMQDRQLFRQRNGAYGLVKRPRHGPNQNCGPSAVTVQPGSTTCQRNRSTPSERALDQRAADFHIGPGAVRIRRMLERPFGSVR